MDRYDLGFVRQHMPSTYVYLVEGIICKVAYNNVEGRGMWGCNGACAMGTHQGYFEEGRRQVTAAAARQSATHWLTRCCSTSMVIDYKGIYGAISNSNQTTNQI